MPEQVDWVVVGGFLVVLAAFRGRLLPALCIALVLFGNAALTADVPAGAFATVSEFFGFLLYLEPVGAAILVALALFPKDADA